MSENSVSSDLVVALVKKACDGLAVLATSVDEINSLKRLTVLLELQKSWESKTNLPGQEKHEDRYQHHSKDNDRENNIADIVVCHDCGQSELSLPQKSPPPFICSQCGLGFQKCLTLMRHLLTHNTSNNFNNMTNHNNGVDSGHANNNNGSPLAILSQDRNKDFYIFMDPSGNKETGSDMNVKLENAFGNIYEEEDDEDDDDEDEDDDDDDDYNDNGDDEDDDYSRESQNKNNSGILNNAQNVRNNMESESSNGLKKEENNSSGHSNESYNDKGGSSSKTQLGSSRYSFFPKLECPACGRHFRRTNSLKNHMAIHTSRGPFFSHAQRNSSSNHSGRYKRSRSPLDNDDRPALCCDCGKQFVNLKRLKIHALSHSAPERFSCNKCPLKFSVAASLKRHLQRHSGIRPHVCSKCGKSFVRSDELTAHERLHSNRNRFPCPVCGKGFTRSIDMVRHQSCHETTKPYQCNQCDKSFVRHDFLKKHESTHLSRACPFCKDVFDNRRNITLHIKKEHPDKSVEDLFNISQSKLVVNPEAYNDAQSIVSILEPNNLFEVPRSSLQIEFSPLVDDSISASVSLANPHQLIGQSVEREYS